MRVHCGSDHAGLELKAHLVRWLGTQGHDVRDHGPYAYEPDDDYPPYCFRTATAVVADPGSLGVVIGGSGNGEQIAANKVAGVRAALAWSMETAELSRLHNDANVLSIGARMHPLEEATNFVQVFVTTSFTGESRHLRRIEMLAAYEQTGAVPEGERVAQDRGSQAAGD
ncbi:MAG: ribose-5-phosphate isomerase [Nocardioidaceae bacterium]